MERIIEVKKGNVVFYEGAEEGWMFDIEYGSVGIYADFGTPQQRLLVTLKAENFFGEMGMIEKLPRSATAVALENTRLSVITEETFAEHFEDKPAKILEILQYTSRRLRALSRDYVEAGITVSAYVRAKEAGQEPDAEVMEKMRAIAKKKGKK